MTHIVIRIFFIIWLIYWEWLTQSDFTFEELFKKFLLCIYFIIWLKGFYLCFCCNFFCYCFWVMVSLDLVVLSCVRDLLLWSFYYVLSNAHPHSTTVGDCCFHYLNGARLSIPSKRLLFWSRWKALSRVMPLPLSSTVLVLYPFDAV
jgi:hypothetical protein